jgi:hypothetical protein
MPREFVVRGVPRRIARDAWWLAADTLRGDGPAEGNDGGDGRDGIELGTGGRVGLIALVVLGDILFWGHPAGISLAIFAGAVLFVAGIGRPPRLRIVSGLLFAILAAPVVDHVQPLAIGFLTVGSIVALAVLHAPGFRSRQVAAKSLGLLSSLPERWIRGIVPLRKSGVAAGVPALGAILSRPAVWLRDWAFPLGGSFVVLALLMNANPVFLRLGAEYLEPWNLAQRVLFWAGLAVLTAPFLSAELPEASLPKATTIRRVPGLGLNGRAVLRALVMFNLLVAMQMVTDVSILIGGETLPSGMTYAEYAHRGAYPLLATAMLAGAFAVVAQPFSREHRLIRPLMLLWLAQNVVLTGAAAMRLDLYVEAYGLTYLRLYATIWMVLVALGLALTGWQVLRDHAATWLIVRFVAFSVATLYLCSFVNLTAVVAAQNLSRPAPDMGYVCGLGPTAAGALRASPAARLPDATGRGNACAAQRPPRIEGWRDWEFRSWRLIRKVEAARHRSSVDEDPHRR